MTEHAGLRHEAQATTETAELSRNKAHDLSPGEILRESRLAHHYSIDDLCAQTRLTPRMIGALEDNDYPSLSQPAFARGYYRRCAKVLDIDTERLMAAYDRQTGESRSAVGPRPAAAHARSGRGTPSVRDSRLRSGYATPHKRRNAGVVAIAGAVVVLLLALAIFWPALTGGGGREGGQRAVDANGNTTVELSPQQPEDSGGQGPADGGAESNNAAAAQSRQADQDTAFPNDGAAPSVAGNPDQSDPSAADDAARAGAPAATASGAAALPRGDATSRGDMATESDGATAGNSALSANGAGGLAAAGQNSDQNSGAGTNGTSSMLGSPAASAGDNGSANIAPDRLQLTFSKRCWVSVHDADGKRLLVGIFTAGQTRIVTGKTPYRLDLGVAEGVAVTIGGQTVDVAPHIRGGVARFTVNARTGQ